MRNTIILLHGALGSKEQFSTLKSLLADKYTVYDFNFEGHGGHSTDKAYSIDLFVDNTIDFMAKNEITVANFFGYSMGGYVALKLAMKYPEKVNKVMTLATKFDWNKEVAEREVRKLNPLKIVEKVPKFAQILQETHKPDDWQVVVNKTAQMMSELGNGSAITLNEFKTIEHPVLISVGSKDEMVTVEESQKVADQLKNGNSLIINDLYHPIEKVDKVELVTTIEQFFM